MQRGRDIEAQFNLGVIEFGQELLRQPKPPLVLGVKLLLMVGVANTIKFAVANAALLPVLVCKPLTAILLV